VNFLLASSFSLRSEKDVQVYKDLAHISGGQTIEVTNTTLSQANAAITDAITADL
ncbi:hypothetical protein M9458_001428, partial [Cirrhinus mrigala]